MAWDQRRRPPSEYIHPAKARRVLAAHAGICHTCHHPHAEQVDHVTPWAEWTRQDVSVHDPTNLAPMHGSPCPVCGVSCHEDKSKAEAARGRARAQAKRATSAHRPPEAHPGSVSHG